MLILFMCWWLSVMIQFPPHTADAAFTEITKDLNDLVKSAADHWFVINAKNKGNNDIWSLI